MHALSIGRNRAFSLIELVIVVVIIGIIAAIAIPRMSRGAAGASDNALVGNLAVLRKAIDLYASEHAGAFPAADKIVEQLTQYTDQDGNVSVTKTGAFIFGPYIRSIPAITVGPMRGQNTISDKPGEGAWLYNATDGTIRANTTTEADAAGTPYSAY
jgi:prepilin-type N-terminal cleavage/methylation domain-containing protein